MSAVAQVFVPCVTLHSTHRSIVMEGLQPLHRRVAGSDVHRMLHVVTILIELPDGSMQRESREFGGFKRDCRALAHWLAEQRIELVVMESTGICWKSVHAHLERAGIQAWLVNAHFIKHVPGRKTDMADSEWLAVLARFGLVRASFISPQDLRELRLVSRYRRKLTAMCASEINRLHKILDDAGLLATCLGGSIVTRGLPSLNLCINSLLVVAVAVNESIAEPECAFSGIRPFVQGSPPCRFFSALGLQSCWRSPLPVLLRLPILRRGLVRTTRTTRQKSRPMSVRRPPRRLSCCAADTGTGRSRVGRSSCRRSSLDRRCRSAPLRRSK